MAEDNLKVQTPDGIREIAVEGSPDRTEGTIDQRMVVVTRAGPVDDQNPLPTKVSGTASVAEASTGRIDATTDSYEIMNANAERRSFMIYNEGPGVMYVAFGPEAHQTQYAFKLNAGDFYESTAPTYTGPVHAIWDETGGHATFTYTHDSLV